MNERFQGISPIITPLDKVNMDNFKNKNPPVPRYRTTWVVDLFLCYLSSLHEPSQVSLKSLTLKTTMLITLVSAQRGWSLCCGLTLFLVRKVLFFFFQTSLKF